MNFAVTSIVPTLEGAPRPLVSLSRADRTLCLDALELSQRVGWTFSVTMADTDFPENVNHQYGHDQGNVVIKAVAALLHSKVRAVDFAGRYGGKQFVLAVREADQHGEVKLAQRLRQGTADQVCERNVGVAKRYGPNQMAPALRNARPKGLELDAQRSARMSFDGVAT